jgi:hypothetical protein
MRHLYFKQRAVKYVYAVQLQGTVDLIKVLGAYGRVDVCELAYALKQNLALFQEHDDRSEREQQKSPLWARSDPFLCHSRIRSVSRSALAPE